jgi:hypothetical protein
MATPGKIPNANELKYNEHKEKPITEVAQVSDDVKSAEERMAKYYEEKEKQASEDYQKTLYESPPPPTDEEILRRKNLWRTNRSQYR